MAFLGISFNTSPAIDWKQHERAVLEFSQLSEKLTVSEINTLIFAYEILKDNTSHKKGIVIGLDGLRELESTKYGLICNNRE